MARAKAKGQRPLAKNPDRRITQIRNRSERRIKHWRHALAVRIRHEKDERRKRIEAIRASLRATQLSDRGAQFIRRFEGFVGHPYNDPVGHCTIGVGHLIHHGNCTAADGRAWGRISETEGLKLLHKDADAFEQAVRDLVRVELDQAQFDALVSFAYNLGAGALASSTLLRKLNAGDYRSVPSQLMRWVNAGGGPLDGLVTRRKAEGELFAHGDY